MNSLPLVAQFAFFTTTMIAATVVVVVLWALLTTLMSLKYYKRCPSNRVLVIYGKTGPGESVTCVTGGGRFVFPVFQAYAWLSLEPMDIEIAPKGVLSKDNIRVNVPSVFTVAIGTTPELMTNAAIRLLGLSERDIKWHAEEIISGQLPLVIASMQIEDLNLDRDRVLENILNSLEPELRKIGLVLINVNIKDITDDSGYIKAIDQKATVTALLRKLLEEGKLSDKDREEIRRLLDDSSSLP